MAFTNIWDDTFPPDTQVASLIGQDMRNLRLDIQQRMASISGISTSLPSFGSDAQPSNWNGVLFFALDTNQIFQWQNPAWINVTGQVNKPTVVASLDLTGQTANSSGTVLTPAASGQFRFSFNSKATTNGSGILGPMTIGYTDPDGTLQSITCGCQDSALDQGGAGPGSGGSLIPSLNGSAHVSTTNPLLGYPILLNCLGGFSITYFFVCTGGGIVYNLHARLEAL